MADPAFCPASEIDSSGLVCVLCYEPEVVMAARIVRASDPKEPHYDRIIAPHVTVVGYCAKCAALVHPTAKACRFWIAVAEERARAATASGVPTKICRSVVPLRNRTRGGLN